MCSLNPPPFVLSPSQHERGGTASNLLPFWSLQRVICLISGWQIAPAAAGRTRGFPNWAGGAEGIALMRVDGKAWRTRVPVDLNPSFYDSTLTPCRMPRCAEGGQGIALTGRGMLTSATRASATTQDVSTTTILVQGESERCE